MNDIMYQSLLGISLLIIFCTTVYIIFLMFQRGRIKKYNESLKTTYTIQIIRPCCNNTDHVVMYEETLSAYDGDEASKIVSHKYKSLQPMVDYSNLYINVVMPDNPTTENNSNE